MIHFLFEKPEYQSGGFATERLSQWIPPDGSHRRVLRVFVSGWSMNRGLDMAWSPAPFLRIDGEYIIHLL